ncbi:hypothetical protein GGR57DRAFT_34099 [Xylariaceae sp. FL1272]|nr:hypothetical protein GGR57DRAFT_34099 [Xylariaceae sp. FL1272]
MAESNDPAHACALAVSHEQAPAANDATHSEDIGSKARTQTQFPQIENAIASESIESAEPFCRLSVKILKEIADILDSAKTETNTTRWSHSIKSILQKAKTPHTIIGVVGGTGQGKSSVINAILGEEKLLPTNCMRACTAVITELAWNQSEDPTRLYAAEIEFISTEEWHQELIHLCQDFGDSSDGLEMNNATTDAGVAWAKIQAVYPYMTKEALALTNLTLLANSSAVEEILGTTKTVYESNACAFNKSIRTYVDSREKVQFSDDMGRSQTKDAAIGELWPLIKVVRIFTKADALSTGAILVDLPGVEDSNAARAAIAGKYIEKCNALWVVANITRAIDDKVAQKLLGQSFKQQLRYDGKYSNVTFICSKTDDISIMAAVEPLGLAREFDEFEEAEHAQKKWELKGNTKLQNDKNRAQSLMSLLVELNKQLGLWESCGERQGRGLIAKFPTPMKRKAQSFLASTPEKRRRLRSDNMAEEVAQYVSCEEYWKDLGENMPKVDGDEVLTQERVQNVAAYLRFMKERVTKEKIQLDQTIMECEQQGSVIEDEYYDLKENLRRSCVSRRNDYTRMSIRQQFVQGIKELDEENAENEDLGTSDPEQGPRDYEELARSVAVFCVSSQAYQGFAKGEFVGGFENPEATEIPQLIEHTKSLTDGRRLTKAKAFLNDLLQSLNSLYIWSSEHDFDVPLTEDEKRVEMEHIKVALIKLDSEFKTAVNELTKRCKRNLIRRLFNRFQASADHAAQRAPGIAQKWPQRQRGDGGLPAISYRATCRRGGAFSGILGPRDFNEDLLALMKRSLADSWENTFSKKIPLVLDNFCDHSEELLQNFHQPFKRRLLPKATLTSLEILHHQLKARVAGIHGMIDTFREEITALQRDASRSIKPAIQAQMMPTYNTCAAELGAGMFRRMQSTVLNDLTVGGQTIFRGATTPAKVKLIAMCDKIDSDLSKKLTEMLDQMSLDYSTFLRGKDSLLESKGLRVDIFKLLSEVDSRFASCSLASENDRQTSL